MRIDGRAISLSIRNSLEESFTARADVPRVLLVYAGSDPVIDSYISIKEKVAHEIGVELEVRRFMNATEEELISTITSSSADGIVVQLPLPTRVDTGKVLDSIPWQKDIDVLSRGAFQRFEAGDSPVRPPVVGAIEEVMKSVKFRFENKRVAVVGKGKLVGTPVVTWLKNEGVVPEIIQEGDDLGALQKADLIISGAGKPHLITPDLIKEGVFLIDAGTSVEGGVAKGDIDPGCEGWASYFCGVPGGIGPITVAVLFRNLFYLLSLRN